MISLAASELEFSEAYVDGDEETIVVVRGEAEAEPGPVDAGGGRDRDSARWIEPPSTQSH